MNDDRDYAKPGPDKPDLLALSALVDNELSAAERAATLERLAIDTDAARRVADYRAQNAALKALFAIPQETTRCLVLRRHIPWWQRAGVAAAWLVVGVGLGPWLAPTLVSVFGLVLGSAPAWMAPRLPTDQVAFAQRANIAYAVYAPEQRHPVEVAADEKAQLVTWLSRRLGRSLVVPSLQEYGYALVGGRLLPGEAGPAAQFMYQNVAGERLTLYVTQFSRDTAAVGLLSDGGRNTFYWANQGMGYALSGQVPEIHLRPIALDVCGALGGHPESWR
jgi:anti-sigma factor RsiW